MYTRTEAVAALKLMVGSTGRDPVQYALHSARIGGATQLAAQGISELQIIGVGPSEFGLAWFIDRWGGFHKR